MSYFVLKNFNEIDEGRMPFPIQEYYSLAELAIRWGISETQTQHFIETGKLPCAVWLRRKQFSLGVIKVEKSGYEVFVPQATFWYKGFAGLLPEDCRWVFRYGWTEASTFYCLKNNHHYLQIANIKNQRSLELEDIVVLQKEVLLFEEKFQIEKKVSNENSILNFQSCEKDKSNFSYSDDFQTIQKGGQTMRFGMIQAKVIELLYDASLTNHPWAHGKILLDKSGSQSERLKSVFRNSPYWRELIESDGRGYYRLKS